MLIGRLTDTEQEYQCIEEQLNNHSGWQKVSSYLRMANSGGIGTAKQDMELHACPLGEFESLYF